MDSSTRAAKVKQALDMVQMGKFGERYPTQLSGGQQQRVALARTLVFDPQLVLMDEPLGALDKQLREHMQLELKALHKRLGVTFVYVTHDQSEALTMSDRVAVFDQGVIQQLAPVEDLYEYPENQFVASFIGDNNRLQGSIEALSDGRCQVRLADGVLLTGLNVHQARVGQSVTACIRPERIRLQPLQDGAGVLQARVSGLIYFGDHVRVRCSIRNQDDCFVKLSLRDPALADLAEGRDVNLHIAPEHLRVFL
jgi:putative spermidine/putrescine transport system ATP-binding protein